MRYRYYISTDSGSSYSEVILNPCPKLTTKLEIGDDWRWAYRTSCNELRITKNENSTIYGTLETWFDDDTKLSTQILFEIYRGDNSTGTLIFTGYFSITDGELDNEYCVYSVTPITSDAYSQFDQKNRIDYYKPTGISTDDLRWIDPHTLGTWANVSFDVWNATGRTITNAQDTGALQELAYIPITGYLGLGDKILVNFSAYSKLSGTDPGMYISDTSGAQISDLQSLTASGEYTFTLTANSTNGRLYLRSLSIDTVSFGCTIASLGEIIYLKHNPSVDFTFDGQPLKKVIEYMLDDEMDTGYAAADILSTFIWNDALPTNPPSSIDTYITANPTHNYVTSQTNELNDPYCISLDEFRSYGAANAGAWYWTFTELMNCLHYYLNVYWFIDDDGNFRIEHQKYFEELREAGIDITAGAYVAYKPEIGMKKRRYSKELLMQREHFVNQRDVNEDFIGLDIIYNVYATSNNKRDYTINEFVTDVQNLQDNLEDSEHGLVFVVTVPNGSYYDMQYEPGVLSATNVINGHLSIANCQDKYWMHGRYAGSGTMNGAAETFTSTIPMIQQTVKFHTTSDLNNFGYITTSHGNGIIDEYERNLDTDFVTAKLLYEAY